MTQKYVLIYDLIQKRQAWTVAEVKKEIEKKAFDAKRIARRFGIEHFRWMDCGALFPWLPQNRLAA